ncbi:aspartate/glutamate racemase family protein [bacterium]|nr:aspartate/glutamate racemase family protein [bacterium]
MKQIEQKTIGLIGGMSCESTLEYYRIMNEIISEKCGGLHSAKCIIYSVDFEEIKTLMDQNKWQEITSIMIDYAQKLELIGADAVLICTNTIHKIADKVQNEIGVPLLHIADATGKVIKEQGINKIGLLGTSFTMEEDFYKGRLLEYGIETIIPNKDDREFVNNVIFEELCLGKVKQSSKDRFIKIAEDFARRGAGGIVLGCTELSMILETKDSDIPLFDTARIHIEAAIECSLIENEFVGQNLFLETADYRPFAKPCYSEERIGRILKIIPGEAGPEDSEHTLAYIKNIFPELSGGIIYRPIIVVKQTKNKEGGLILTAMMNGEQIKIELCEDGS